MSNLLESPEALNEFLKLEASDKVVAFSPVHVQMMEIGQYEQNYFDALGENYLQLLNGYSQIGYSWTATRHGKPFFCFGLCMLWPGVAEWWMVPDANLNKVGMPFCRAARQFLDVIKEELLLVRLQCTVCTHNVQADKWIRFMQFESEGTLRKFGPERADYQMYSRLFT